MLESPTLGGTLPSPAHIGRPCEPKVWSPLFFFCPLLVDFNNIGGWTVRRHLR